MVLYGVTNCNARVGLGLCGHRGGGRGRGAGAMDTWQSKWEPPRCVRPGPSQPRPQPPPLDALPAPPFSPRSPSSLPRLSREGSFALGR